MTPEELELFSLAARVDGLRGFIAVSSAFQALPEQQKQAKLSTLDSLRTQLAEKRTAFDSIRFKK